MRIIAIILLAVIIGAGSFLLWKNMRKEHWAVYYGGPIELSAFQKFDLLIFDSEVHPPLAPLKADGKTVLGYLSLGQADPRRNFYHVFTEKNLLLPASPEIITQYVINIRKPEWSQYVLDTMMPAIMAEGFDGIFIDTLDNVIQPEQADPKKYPDMIKSSVLLVKAIRARYPNIKIMVNRGFELLPFIANDIDMELAESLYTNVLPGDKHVIREPQEYQSLMALLQNARLQSPSLKVYSLDYWPPQDKEGVVRLYQDERKKFGFIPYVSTMDLQSVYPEP